MKTKYILSLLFIYLLSISSLVSQTSTKVSQDEKMEWWRDAKLGMFIHWGPYSLYGGVYNGFNQNNGGAEV